LQYNLFGSLTPTTGIHNSQITQYTLSMDSSIERMDLTKLFHFYQPFLKLWLETYERIIFYSRAVIIGYFS